jgi:transcriptional regulator with XRE-family HTH domain
MKNNVFVQRIAYALKKQKSTQRRLAGITGIPPQMISDYVNGKYVPRQANLKKIALALDCTEAWLIGDEIGVNTDFQCLDTLLDTIDHIKISGHELFKFSEQITNLLDVDPIYSGKYNLLLELLANLNYIGLDKLVGYANDLSFSGRYKLSVNDLAPKEINTNT